MGWWDEIEAMCVDPGRHTTRAEWEERVWNSEPRLLDRYPGRSSSIERFYDCFARRHDCSQCLALLLEGRAEYRSPFPPQEVDSGSRSADRIKAFLASATVLTGELDSLAREIDLPSMSEPATMDTGARESLQAHFLKVQRLLNDFSGKYADLLQTEAELVAFAGEGDAKRLLRMGRILESSARFVIYPTHIDTPEPAAFEDPPSTVEGTMVEVEISPALRAATRQFDCEHPFAPDFGPSQHRGFFSDCQ